MDASHLNALEELGVPARGDLPFGANWFKIVEDILARNPHSASWIATLLYTEWGFAYWLHTTIRLGILKTFKMKTIKDDELDALNKLIRGNGVASVGVSPVDLLCKWWLDDLALKIRSAWDKLPHAIAETSPTKVKLKARKHNSRLNELEKSAGKLGLNESGRQLLSVLLPEMRNIDYVKDHRDTELHLHSKAYQEVFGFPKKHESLSKVPTRLFHELGRIREAVMATTCLLLTGRT